MEDIHTLLYVVGAGCGVSLVPDTLVPSTHHDVSLVPLHDTGATLELAMVWRPDHTPPVLEGFLETVRAWAGGLRNGKPRDAKG